MGDRKVAVTFDVDFTDYESGGNLDELEVVFEGIVAVLKSFPAIKTTWFIRIDAQIEEVYGRAEHILEKHIDKMNWLQQNGHELGWHHHAYKLESGRWIQDIDDDAVLQGLEKYGKIAREQGMSVARMGWGYMTNKQMNLLDGLGFVVDSSAIPRPKYQWELSIKDWSNTPYNAYHPSKEDYRIGGKPSLQIWEVPMSVAPISAITDTEEGVLRYLNPAYHNDVFRSGVEQSLGKDQLVTISHPYEFIASEKQHPLMAYSLVSLQENLKFLSASFTNFVTISESFPAGKLNN
jgi:hypothetical protein